MKIIRGSLLFISCLIVITACREEPREVQTETAEYLDAASFRQGMIRGLQYPIGTPFEEIVHDLGQPVEEGYYNGGLYHKYEPKDKPYYLYFFGFDTGGIVEHIIIFPNKKLSLDRVRERLGTADRDYFDDVLTGRWMLNYNYSSGFSVYVEGTGSEPDGEVFSLFLKTEPK